jgi:predicted DNA-binding protein
MAATKKKKGLGKPTTIRLPDDLEAWAEKRGVQHPKGKAGVIRDAIAAAYHADTQDALRDHLLQAVK